MDDPNTACWKLSCSDALVAVPPINIWIQGIVVSITTIDKYNFLLVDDGTGVMDVSTETLQSSKKLIEIGDYLFFQGGLRIIENPEAYIQRNDNYKIKRLIRVRSSGFVDNCNMETFWILSLLESQELVNVG